jgi:transcriptional regulator with XRE-family HTH domain
MPGSPQTPVYFFNLDAYTYPCIKRSCRTLCDNVEAGEQMAILDVAPRRAILDLEEHLGLTPEIMASALGVEKRSIARWRSGTEYPRAKSRAALSTLHELHDRPLYTFTPRDAQDWLRENNEYLAGLTPLEVLQAGRVDRVTAALEALDSGIFL